MTAAASTEAKWCEGEADADLRREPAAIVARPEQPDRRQRRVGGHRRDRPEGVALGEASIPEDQLLQALEEIVAAARLLQTSEREGGELVGAGRAPEAEVDPAREQRLERLEALGDDERRVVRQHHAAGADADALRRRRDLADHDLGRRVRDRWQVVVLGEPVAGVAERVGVAGEIEAVAQGRARRRARGHEGEVEDRQRRHRHAGSASPERIASATARPIATVPSLPPMSCERTRASPKARSMLVSIARAASRASSLPWRSASQSSISAVERIIAVGLAMPRPAISGPVPWLGWNSPCLSPMSAEGAKPMPPTSPAPRSERMSPNRFSIGSTSKSQGRRTRSSAMAST